MSRFADLADIPPLQIWGEAVAARRIEGRRMTFSVIELAPGAAVPVHEHPAEQIGICVQGRLTMTVGDETRTLGPGETWSIPSGVPHAAEAGSEGAVAVEAFSPMRDDWDFLVLAPRPPVWPADG